MLSQGEKSADFPKDPFCEVSRMTNTTCARCENSFLNRADGIPRPASLGEKITADHITETLSLYKMRSRIGSKVILRGVKIRRKERHAISGFLLPFKNLGESTETHPMFSLESVNPSKTDDTNTPHRSETNGIAE